MDTAFNKDFGFQLEGQTPNNYAETPISHLSNVSQSDMFNCSPSDFFNRGNNADIGKNMKGINISDQDNEFKKLNLQYNDGKVQNIKVFKIPKMIFTLYHQ